MNPRKVSELIVASETILELPALVTIVARDRHHEASALVEILSDEGIVGELAVCSDDAIATIERRHPDLVLVDEDASPVSELAALLTSIRNRFPDTATVLMTSRGSNDPKILTALARVERWYLLKPIDVDELVRLTRAVTAYRRGGRGNVLQPSRLRDFT